MSLRFIKDYMGDEILRPSLTSQLKAQFGVDLETWYHRVGLREDYKPYSYADGNTIAASVSVSDMTFRMDGKPLRCVQLGGVYTNPAYRGQGLSRLLLQRIIEDHKENCDFIYLFANDTVLGFYPRFGFVERAQTIYTAPLQPQGLVKERTSSFPKGRPAARLYHENGEGLLAFYQGLYPENVAAFGGLRAVVSVEEETFNIHQIWGEGDLYAFACAVAPEGTKTLRLGFTPLAPVDPRFIREKVREEHLFVLPCKGDWDEDFAFPDLSIG